MGTLGLGYLLCSREHLGYSSEFPGCLIPNEVKKPGLSGGSPKSGSLTMAAGSMPTFTVTWQVVATYINLLWNHEEHL